MVSKRENEASSSNLHNHQDYKKLWNCIWKEGEIPPRIRLFCWKLAQGALPLGSTMHRRLGRGDPMCMLCGQMEETEVHLAFSCPFARSYWFAGPLALRSDGFNAPIKECLLNLTKIIPMELWDKLTTSLWSLWRCRNDLVFQGKTPTFQAFQVYSRGIEFESILASSVKLRHVRIEPVNEAAGESLTSYFIYHVDGSWMEGWMGGGYGFIFTRGGSMHMYRVARIQVCSAAQSEATTLLSAMKYAEQEGLTSCHFFTDCKSLAEAVSSFAPPMDVDWTAHKEMFHIWQKIKVNRGFSCSFIARQHNTVADELARKGRMLGVEYTGFTFPCFGQSL